MLQVFLLLSIFVLGYVTDFSNTVARDSTRLMLIRMKGDEVWKFGLNSGHSNL